MSPKVRIVDTTQAKAESPAFPLTPGTTKTAQSDTPTSIKKKSFSQLFARHELWHYGIAAAVYIILGVLLQDIVLNFVAGPLFITGWMWFVPPLIDKWKGRRK